MKLLDNPIVNKIVAPIQRRHLLRNVVFGTSVAAITPMLGGVPGVSVASLGFKTSRPMKVHQLIGQALKAELASIEAQPDFKIIADFLVQHGFDRQKRIFEGLEMYTQVGTVWEISHYFAFHYSGSTPATVSYYQSANGKSIGVALNTGANSKDAYKVVGSQLKHVATVVDNGAILTVTASTGQTMMLTKEGVQKLYRLGTTSDVQTSQSVTLDSSSCFCMDICAMVIAAGCSILGSAAECSVICGGPEDVPCVLMCGAMLAIFCAVGGIDCGNFCASYC